jgi:multidrug resistance efflux pump
VGISLLVPVPVHVNASLAVAPRAMRHVYVTTPGRIEAVHARPGERVRRGDVLVRLANDRRVAHLRQLRTAAAAQQIEVDVQEALGDAAQSALARETLRALAAEVAEYERQVARLTIVAPCDGVVIAPVERRSPQGKTWKTLPTWNGSPLDVANRGSFLEAGTHVVSIAPSDRYEAVLRIEEPDRHDFRVGQDVKVQMDHLPGVTLRSRIGHVAHYAVERENSSRAGGPRAVAGRVHEAVVPLACERLPLVPGMRGRAGVLVTHRSAAGWLWRYVCETLQFLV